MATCLSNKINIKMYEFWKKSKMLIIVRGYSFLGIVFEKDLTKHLYKLLIYRLVFKKKQK